MSSYELIVQIDSADVKEINAAKQVVTIVKEVGGSSGEPVAWVAFSPFENNDVSWEEQYGVYASTSQVENGATITKTSAVNPATSEVSYPFQNGTFGSPIPGGPANSYGIANQYSQQFTFGMAQSVTANGSKFDASPLNAVPVLSNEDATFTPIEKIKVFLHAHFNNGVIITNITSKALEVDLTNSPKVTIKYDKASGKFVMA